MDIAAIEDFFKNRKDSLPPRLVLSKGIVIVDLRLFFESHLHIVKLPYAQSNTYRGFHNRLEMVYNLLLAAAA